MNIGDYLYLNNVFDMEGHCNQVPKQAEVLKEFASNHAVKYILEIGFNAGHSADVFLSSNPNVHVVSFDLGEHTCVPFGKKYIDEKYPSRHTLILGDSTKTLPQFIEENPSMKFDLIFIDGGHYDDIPKKDIINCKKVAHSGTIVVIDDIWYNGEIAYTVKVTKAWTEAISWNIIKEISHYGYDDIMRGFSVGMYIF